jgi:hypothetical protein
MAQSTTQPNPPKPPRMTQPRQVTVQPQEKAPEAGQPHVPHTHLQQPGEDEPESQPAGGAAPTR